MNTAVAKIPPDNQSHTKVTPHHKKSANHSLTTKPAGQLLLAGIRTDAIGKNNRFNDKPTPTDYNTTSQVSRVIALTPRFGGAKVRKVRTPEGAVPDNVRGVVRRGIGPQKQTADGRKRLRQG